MHRITALLVASLALAQAATAVEIKQENDNLGNSPGDHWTYLPLTNTIVIKTSTASETYVFWAHEDNDPDTLAEIREITLDQNIDPGTVKLKVSKTESGLTPGATTIGRITIEESGITSILEGVSVTGDFLGEAAMVIDHVTGTIEVGGSLLNAMTVNEDLEGAVTIEGAIVTGADVDILGDVLEPIAVGTYIPNRTASSYDSISAVRSPLTIGSSPPGRSSAGRSLPPVSTGGGQTNLILLSSLFS